MSRLFLLIFLLSLSSCYYVPDTIEPRLSVYAEKRHVEKLKSPFDPLSMSERNSDWGKEYLIALRFAEKFDLYRAISTFKRAEMLIDEGEEERRSEISYLILLCYYLGGKYEDVLLTFEASELLHVDPSFKPYHDLMLILYECYTQLGIEEKSEKIRRLLETHYPDTADTIELSIAMKEGNIEEMEKHQKSHPYLDDLFILYAQEKKSVAAAQGYNALLPGLGYLYLGQKKSAFTAFMINGLFLYSTYYFFHTGNVAAGIITAGFEAGWYFGGIYGAGESAKYYNERVYEKYATPLMNEKKLFPLFMLQYGF